MAAYCQVDDLQSVTCGLTACTLGSTLGSTLGIEYGKPLPFTLHTITIAPMLSIWGNWGNSRHSDSQSSQSSKYIPPKKSGTNFFENFLTVMPSLAVQLVFFLWGPLIMRLLWLDDRVFRWQWKSFCQSHTHTHTQNSIFLIFTILLQQY